MMPVEKKFSLSQIRKRAWLQRLMSQGGWDEKIMHHVFYGDDYLINLVGSWVESVGSARTKLYLERRFLGIGMIDLKQYQSLKKELEETKREMERSKGSFNTLIKQLEDEFNCSTVEDAEELLEELKGESDQLEKKYEKELKQFKKKWEGRL